MHALKPHVYPNAPVDYPCSDGEPMSDNTLQYQWIVTIQGGLDRELPDFVAGNILWYPVEGQPKIRIGPDVLVALGRPKGHRSSYLQWLEDNVVPQVVWEVLSPSNTARELHNKLMFYDEYGVKEFYQVDPKEGWVQGWQREGERLVAIRNMNGWQSPLLGIRFEMSEELRLIHRDGRPFLTFQELAESEETHRQQAKEAQKGAEEARQRAEEARQRADLAEVTAQEALAEAAQERTRAEALAARLRALGVEV